MKKWEKIAAVLMAAVVVSNFQSDLVYADNVVQEERMDSVMEKGDELQYVYVESPYLEAPAVQNIVVSWGNGTEDIQNMSLTVERDDGEQEVWTNSKREANTYLFAKEFENPSEHHTYKIIDMQFVENGTVQNIQLSDLNAAAEFGVNEEYEGYGENVMSLEEESVLESSVVTIDENGQMEAKDDIAEALNAVSSGSEQIQKERGGEIVIALDPGHDNKHGGAVNLREKLIEQELTLKIANYTKAELEQYCGVRVYMTRTTNECPYPGTGKSSECIEQRVLAAAKEGAKIYVSFHLNALEGSSYANGAEVIFPNENWKPQVGADGKALAQKILDQLVKLGLTNRGIYSKDTTIYEKYPDGSVSDYYSVQICNKEHGIPGIIVEHAFLTNSNDVNKFLKTEAGLKSLGIADATGIADFLHLTKGTWEYVDGKGWRFLENGKYVTGTWKYIDTWYYFDAEGYMCTGWVDLYGTYYYLGQDGRMKTDWQYIDNCWYYFDSSGAMQTGWKYIRNGWYYLDASGKMQTGWLEIGGKTYYLNPNGSMVTGVKDIDGISYEFGLDGALIAKAKQGWQKENGKYYYYIRGEKQKGWLWLEGKYYYLGTEGVMRTGWENIGGKWYYLNLNGVMQTGWLEDGNRFFYLHPSGRMAVGTVDISGRTYLFKANGALNAGWQFVEENYYYIGNDDKKRTGWIYVGNTWYYMNADGIMQTGWLEDGGSTYYLYSSGGMHTGEAMIDGVKYYFDSTGRLVKN